jgi:FtsH-binding integral membrane protein
MESVEKTYRSAIFTIVGTFFLFGCALFAFMSIAVIADLAFKLNYGYTLQMLPLGIAASLGCYGGFWLTRKISKMLSYMRD